MWFSRHMSHAGKKWKLKYDSEELILMVLDPSSLQVLPTRDLIYLTILVI